MLGFGTSAMRASTLLERPDDCFINAAHQQISHDVLPPENLISVIAAMRGKSTGPGVTSIASQMRQRLNQTVVR
jgi:hypothetical protein